MDNKDRLKIISANITYYRKKNNITQKELAEKIGIKPSTLSDYINLRSAPSFGIIQKMADFFGIEKSDIDTTFKEKNDKNDVDLIIENAMMFDGKPLTDEDKKAIRKIIETYMEGK